MDVIGKVITLKNVTLIGFVCENCGELPEYCNTWLAEDWQSKKQLVCPLCEESEVIPLIDGEVIKENG